MGVAWIIIYPAPIPERQMGLFEELREGGGISSSTTSGQIRVKLTDQLLASRAIGQEDLTVDM